MDTRNLHITPFYHTHNNHFEWNRENAKIIKNYNFRRCLYGLISYYKVPPLLRPGL